MIPTNNTQPLTAKNVHTRILPQYKRLQVSKYYCQQPLLFRHSLRRRIVSLPVAIVALLLTLYGDIYPQHLNQQSILRLVAVPFGVVHAYSTGAGSCPNGVPAVGGVHTEIANGKISSGSNLFENDFVVTINDTVIAPITTTTATLNPSLFINTPYTISVYNNRYSYKGILIRMQVPNATSSSTTTTTTSSGNFTFIPSTNTQLSFPCFVQGSNVAGITHTNSTLKNIHSGIVEMDVPTSNVTFDITVVGVNNGTLSLYGYDRFFINFVDPTVPITGSPTRSPALPAAVSIAPTNAPTDMPTTEAPTITNITIATLAPTITAPDIVVPKLRKNVNSTTNEIENATEYTFIAENVVVQLSYIVSSSLTDGEIRAYERITSQWYNDFYNDNFYTVNNGTTNNTSDVITVKYMGEPSDGTTAITTDEQLVSNNTNRQLQKDTNELLSLSDNFGIIMGSMLSTINVTNITYTPYVADEGEKGDAQGIGDGGNVTMKTTVQIAYTQSISYRINSSTDNKSGTTRNMQQQYITIPYRSRIGRQLYIRSLIESNIYTFSQLQYRDILSTDTLSVPALVGPPHLTIPNESTAKTEEKKKFASGYIAVITVGGIVVIAAAIIIFQNNKYRLSPKGVTDEDVSASILLAQQRQQYNDEIGTTRLHDNTTLQTSGNTGQTKSMSNKNNNNREYVIYAPAGRLGIVLDDPNVLSNVSKCDIQCGPVISTIKEGSPLIDDNNMNVGDMIVAIDDIDVRNMTPQRVSKLINDRSKHPIRKITCIQIPNMIQNINLPE